MSILYSYYSGILVDAVTSGAIIGAIVGVIVFTASTASEGLHRVIAGFLIGGVLMGVFQTLMVSAGTGIGIGTSVSPLLESGASPVGAMVGEAVIRTLQASLAGGLFMVVSLAPLRAFLGAIAGVIIGIAAAVAAWGILQYVEVNVPLVIFYVLILGVILFILDNLPVRN